MKKLKLDLDAISIESFEPVAGRHRGAGTVRGRSETDVEQSDCCITHPWGTCGAKCTDGWSCFQSQCDCGGTQVKLCSIDYCNSIGAC